MTITTRTFSLPAFYHASACLCMQSSILLWEIRPSVCPSATPGGWYCIDTNAPIVKLFPLAGMQASWRVTLVRLQNSKGNSLNGGVKYTVGRKICDFWHQSINQSINQFNRNLAAREPGSKWYAVEIIDKTAYETMCIYVHRCCERCVESVRSHYVGW